MPAMDAQGVSAYVPNHLLQELHDAVFNQRFRSSMELSKEQRRRTDRKVAYRSREIQELGEIVEEKGREEHLIEQYCLELLGLQTKVRSEVVQELRLKELCVGPDSRIYDWGLLRIRRSGTSYLGYGESGET